MPMAQNSPGGEVGHRKADPHRPAAGRASDRHQPAHALRDLIESGTLVPSCPKPEMLPETMRGLIRRRLS